MQRILAAAMRRISLALVLGVLTAAPGRAAFHLAVIDELMSGVNGDTSVQYVEVRMINMAAQIAVAGTRLTAFDCTGTSHTILLQVPNNLAHGGQDVRWIMGSASFAAAAGITPDFTWPVGSLPTCGMVCWGAPGVTVPQNPPAWDAGNPENYVDCVAYGGYSGPTKTSSGNATGWPPGDGTNSLTRLTTTGSNLADFQLETPTPTNNAGSTGTFTVGSTTTTASTTTTTGLDTTSTTGVGATTTTSSTTTSDTSATTTTDTAPTTTAPSSTTTSTSPTTSRPTVTTSSSTTTLPPGAGCTPAGMLACDDGDACTADGCAPGTGCTHDRVTSAGDLPRIAPACIGQPVPAAIAQQLASGCTSIDAASGQPAKKAKAALGRAVRGLKRAAKAAQRAGTRKKNPISAGCAAALESALGGARDQALREKSAL